MPIVAISLLVILLGLALVLDRSWMDIAQTELLRASEAGALAGARALANDDLLRPQHNPQATVDRVRAAVEDAANNNRVAGEPVRIVQDEDIALGRESFDEETGKHIFLATDRRPNTVQVTARLSEHRENPVALLMRQVTGQATAELAQQVAATADNRILGVRPFQGATVPGIPFAILADDPGNSRQDTWMRQIVQGMGQDQFGYNEKNHKITSGPDGIREIILTGEDPQDQSVKPNVAMVDLGNGLRATGLISQIQDGWTARQLRAVGGQILLPSQPITLSSTAKLTIGPLRALTALEGESRICLLYLGSTKEGSSTPGSVNCVGLVAGRVMQVIPSQTKASKIIFQPAVIVTRTAVLPELRFNGDRQQAEREWLNPHKNRYLYKTCLTQ